MGMAFQSAGAGDVSIDQFIEEKLTEYQVPGAVVAVVRDDRVVLLKGYGVRDFKTMAKVNPDTLFQLASITKTFAAAAFGTNVDKKEASWEKPVKDFLPAFRLKDDYATRWCTEDDLLAHRTGLPAFEGGLLEMVGFSRGEILSKIAQIEPETSFRNKALYSNVGYFLAGEASAYAAKKLSWADLVRERLLTPLRMTSTGLSDECLPSAANVARPYVKTQDGRIEGTRPNYGPTLCPAGALASTGRDMVNYLRMWLNDGKFEGNPILEPETVKHIFTPVIAEHPGFAELPPISEETGFDFTPGWGIYHFQNYRVLEKGGALEGYRTVVVLVPEKKWGVVILSNLNLTLFPEAVRAELLERELGRSGEDLQAEIRKRAANIDRMLLPPTPPANAKPPTLSLNAYAGTYTNNYYGTWKVSCDGGLPSIAAGPAQFKGAVRPFNGDTFLVSWPLANAGIHDVAFQVSNGKVSGFRFDEKYNFTRTPDNPNTSLP